MSTLSWERRVCTVPAPEKIPAGIDALADGMIGWWRRFVALYSIRATATAADKLGEEFARLSDIELQRRIELLRSSFRRGRNIDALLPEAIATVRENAARSLGLRPHFVQLLGALALQRGFLAEMATGEGKSLTAALAACLAGWTGLPCHVITVNDYLAERDAARFAPLYRACGLSVGHVAGQMAAPERALGYAAEVTYTTSKEVAADFLRDRLALGSIKSATRWTLQLLAGSKSGNDGTVVMRGLHSAIIDEADSVLIDEAVTPLIIAGPGTGDENEQTFQLAWSVASQMQSGVDYRVDHAGREVVLLPAGVHRIAAVAAQLPAIWRAAARQRELITQALHARELFHAGRQYIVEKGEVVIVDEFTGRMMPMRKWRHGLHQAIEAKEGISISKPDDTLARMSFQRFFRQYKHLAGMTGTAEDAAAEFWRVYRLPVVTIPPNRPRKRVDLPDRLFADTEAKWTAVAEEVARLQSTGRPVLIGTRSIASSELLAKRLRQRGLEPAVLNATRHHEEAAIIASAGQRGKVTIATNMAGRGTDIELSSEVRAVGGLHVIATERHESIRIDRQLFGRAGRQGDPGSAQAFISAEDELLRRHAGAGGCRMLSVAARRGIPGASALARRVIARAQTHAQRQAYLQRQGVLRQDDWLDRSLTFAG